MTQAVLISVEHVNKEVRYGDELISILRDLSLTIYDGESLAICGASGSGKTTLLGLLSGMDIPTSGSIRFKNMELATMDEEARAKVRAEHIGFVFQSFQLVATLTALENVMLPLELKGANDPEKLAREFLGEVGLTHRFQHFPSSLSGGEQQRVAIARAFACMPSVLFADEPTGNLDRKTGDSICDLLFSLNRDSSTTLVLVTHDERLAERCDRTVHLLDGHFAPGEVEAMTEGG